MKPQIRIQFPDETPKCEMCERLVKGFLLCCSEECARKWVEKYIDNGIKK